MKTEIYKLSLRQKSALLTPLQSDTIFGAFCWRLKEYQGETALAAFLDFFKQGSPVFTISDAFYETQEEDDILLPRLFFPIPKPQEVGLDRKEMLLQKARYKKNDQKPFISIRALNRFFTGALDEYWSVLSESQEEFTGIETHSRTSVKINTSTFSHEDGGLYHYKTEVLSSRYNYCVFIKVLQPELFNQYSCQQMLKATFNHAGFGKKKSSGYGQFEVLKFERCNVFEEAKNPNGFITLSHYLPSENDKITDAFYDIRLKYGKLGEQFASDEKPFKKPVYLMKPGSCFKTADPGRLFYGRCTGEGEISSFKKEIIQNGYCFNLNVNI